jgi:hypothetical protein
MALAEAAGVVAEEMQAMLEGTLPLHQVRQQHH